MNNDIIKSYLVSLGFTVNQPQLDQFNSALKVAGYEVIKLTGGMAQQFAIAGTAVIGTLASIAAGTVALMDHTAQADLGYQLFARRMFMSADAAKQLKIATDALGYSLEDIVWGPPELQERFHQLLLDQKELQGGLGGAGFETQMRQLRDIRFEFTRFGVEVQYFSMSLTKALSTTLFGDEGSLLKKLQQFNTWFIQNTPRLSEVVSTQLGPALKDIYATGKDLASVLGDITSEFIAFSGGLLDDEKIKDGKVSIENLVRVMRDWVQATRDVADGFKILWDSLRPPDWMMHLIPNTPYAEKKKQEATAPENLSGAATAAAKRYGVDPALVMGLIDKESAWNPKAKNPKSGAYGLMQLMPENLNKYGENGLDAEQNLDIGVRLLSELLKRHHGDVRGALKDYGGFVTQDPTEYQDYVMRHAQKYRESLSPSPMAYHEGGNTYGDIHVHVNHPNATPEEIGQAVREAIREHDGRKTQQNLTQLSGSYA